MDAIAAIKDRISLASLVGEYVTLKPLGKEHIALCPFHSEKTPSLRVHQSYAKCFGCGWAGDVIDFYAAIESVGKGAAIKALADRAGVTLDGRAPTRLERKLEKQEREFALWWQKHRYTELKLRLVLMLEGSLWSDRPGAWNLHMQDKCIELGERSWTLHQAKGVELRAMAAQATDKERAEWKADRQNAEWWASTLVATLASLPDQTVPLGWRRWAKRIDG